MANFKRRKRADTRRRSYGKKCYLARGVQKRDWWDNFPKMSTRQRLKAELREEMA